MLLATFPENLLHFFKTVFQLDEPQLIQLADSFTLKKIKKKEFYLKQGEIAKSKAFLVKGLMRVFYVDDHLKENTLFFRFENAWIGDIESYHQQTPSKINIQALEDCEILLIQKANFDKLEKQIPKLEKWYAINAVKMYASLFNKLMEAKLRTSEEKYLYLMKHEPQIFQRVPLQYIAAYLEIEPQSLSRLRKRLLKKGK